MSDVAPQLDPITEASQLVQALHAPGNAGNAKVIQDRLQFLQKTEAGWSIADALLNSDDATQRFFGSLTLTVKIHQEWDAMGREEAQGLLYRLLNCFLLLANRLEAPFVMRKFLTTLSTYYYKPKAPWTYFLRQCALCMAESRCMPEEECPQEKLSMAISSLDQAKLTILLSLSTTLAEDFTSRTAGNDNDLRIRLISNLNDAIYLVGYVLDASLSASNGATPNGAFASEELCDTVTGAIKSLNAWLSVSRMSRVPFVDLQQAAALPLNHVITLLTVPEIAPPAMELITDVLYYSPKLINRDQILAILNFLSGPLGERYAISLLEGVYEEDTRQFLELLLIYAKTEYLELLTGPQNLQSERVVFLLHTLFRIPGYAEVEDKASPLLLEFWTNAADDVSDSLMQGDIESIPDRVKHEFAQAISDCYEKLRYPDPQTLREWDDDEKRSFNGFRRDFADFLLATYPFLNTALVLQLRERAVAAMASQDWNSFEVAIFCLAYLSEGVSDREDLDPILHEIFLSKHFDSICFKQIALPTKARQTLSDMMARYTAYFERNQYTIPKSLNFLFDSLETPGCDGSASKSISTMCQSCRGTLSIYVEEFINKFNMLQMNPATGTATLERIAEGIAAVVQAVPAPDTQVACLSSMLGPMQRLAEEAQGLAQTGAKEDALVPAVKAIRCTASIGKGFREQDDGVIDLEGPTDDAPARAFWSAGGPGGPLQACIITILDVLVRTFPFDGQIIESTCDVLKAGYTESKPGPYVLPPEVTVRFVKASAVIDSPQFPTIMATASSFLNSHALHRSEIADGAIELVLHVSELITYMNGSPERYDPEVAHSCIDFLQHLLRKHSGTFFDVARAQPDGIAILELILDFTVRVLKGPEPLALRSASSFWSALLSLQDPPSEFQPSPNLRPAAGTPQPFFDRCLASLSLVVIRQVSGNCARSDLEHLSEVLKKFIFKYLGVARLHLGNALAAPNLVGAGVGAHLSTVKGEEDLQQQEQQQQQQQRGPSRADKERFLSSILSCRGGRQTTQLVRDFWVSCRGKGFAYAG